MKVSLAQLYFSIPAFKELYLKPLRPVVSLRITKAGRFAEKHAADYEAARVKLAEECSELEDGKPKTENGTYVLADKQRFNDGLQALLAETYDLPPSVKQIPADHFDDPLSPSVVGSLDWLIVESDDK